MSAPPLGWKGGRVLITGASGFVGRHVVDMGRRLGVELHSLGRHSAGADVEFHAGEIEDEARVAEVVRNVAPTGMRAWPKASICFSRATTTRSPQASAPRSKKRSPGGRPSRFSPRCQISRWTAIGRRARMSAGWRRAAKSRGCSEFFTSRLSATSWCVAGTISRTMRTAFAASLYPYVAVLLRILAQERARWVPEPLFEFEEQFKSWNQPLLTAVDLTRVYADELLAPAGDRALARALYDRTVRSIPRAFLNRKLGRPDQPGNKYVSLALGNLLACYRCSRKHQLMAFAYWLAGTVLPASALRKLLGEKPRKVEF